MLTGIKNIFGAMQRGEKMLSIIKNNKTRPQLWKYLANR